MTRTSKKNRPAGAKRGGRGTRGTAGAGAGRRPLNLSLGRLSAALASRGVELRRSAVLEVLAEAAGLRDGNEIAAMAAAGDLTPEPLVAEGVATLPDGTTLVAGRDSRGRRVALEAGLVAGDRYVVAPWGGIVDAAALAGGAGPRAEDARGRRFHRTRVTFEVLSEDPIADCSDVASIVAEADSGSFVMGNVSSAGRVVDAREASEALLAFGSDPDFFDLVGGVGVDDAEGEDDDADDFDAAAETARLDRFERENEARIGRCVAGIAAAGLPAAVRDALLDEAVHDAAGNVDAGGAASGWASDLNNDGHARQVAFVLQENGPDAGEEVVAAAIRAALRERGGAGGDEAEVGVPPVASAAIVASVVRQIGVVRRGERPADLAAYARGLLGFELRDGMRVTMRVETRGDDDEGVERTLPAGSPGYVCGIHWFSEPQRLAVTVAIPVDDAVSWTTREYRNITAVFDEADDERFPFEPAPPRGATGA